MKPIGSFCLVLHTHLPWVAHHGTWPVGEEWLHQAFTGSWRRVLTMLERLGEHGLTDVATLGVTPIVAAMMDDPYCLDEIRSWTGRWQLRAEELSQRPEWAELAEHERRQAATCLEDVERRWLTGGLSGVLRPLVDNGVIELLGGPATHPFQPLLTDRLAAAQLNTGLEDTAVRIGSRPVGIWAPECGYAPGLEELYAAHGVGHFLVDGPAVRGRTGAGYLVADSEVACFPRDRALSERVWSARTGFPGGSAYRDFHAFDHRSGFRAFRVTGRDVAAEHKRPWDPQRASAAAVRDARSFVQAVVDRLGELSAVHGDRGLVVAAFDTELFGHWWYEGPEFLAMVLRMLPQAGVQLTTLSRARENTAVSERIELPASSWGAGQDWRVWDNDQVAGLVAEMTHMQKRLFTIIDRFAQADPVGRSTDGPVRHEHTSVTGRDATLDQLAREALLLTSSDWAFMVTRDSAADYAHQRAAVHARRFHELADLIEAGRTHAARAMANELRALDGPFGQLDARLF